MRKEKGPHENPKGMIRIEKWGEEYWVVGTEIQIRVESVEAGEALIEELTNKITKKSG